MMKDTSIEFETEMAFERLIGALWITSGTLIVLLIVLMVYAAAEPERTQAATNEIRPYSQGIEINRGFFKLILNDCSELER